MSTLRKLAKSAPPWAVIRGDYVHGGDNVTLRSLAQAYGLNAETVKSRAKVERWTALRETARSVVRGAANEVQSVVVSKLETSGLVDDAKKRIETWVENALTTAGKIVARVDAAVPAAPDETLPALATTLDRADRVGRRSLGLDQPEGKATIVNYGRLQVNYRTAGSLTTASTAEPDPEPNEGVIDV